MQQQGHGAALLFCGLCQWGAVAVRIQVGNQGKVLIILPPLPQLQPGNNLMLGLCLPCPPTLHVPRLRILLAMGENSAALTTTHRPWGKDSGKMKKALCVRITLESL
jgi:hypothetical protein